MTEPTITCPNCNTEIKLTESLAAPLIASTRLDFQQRLAAKDAEIAHREAKFREQEEALALEKERIEDTLAERLKGERVKLAAEAEKKAKLAVGDALDAKAREVSELMEVLKERDQKLAAAQQVQAELMKKQRELDDARRELELTIETRVQAGLDTTRDQARKEAEEAQRLKVMEKEQTIAAMQRQIEELKRRAEQGSQQLQGEVQELELESLLAAKFSTDTIAPVPKGEYGGDVLQTVFNPLGQPCGTILWESKRTKNWSDTWLPKLRDDQRRCKAEVAIIISHALPKDVESFAIIEGVWVASPRVLIPVAISLRMTLIEVSLARQASEGQQTKTEMVYQYLTGPRFRQRVEAIVEAFSSMQDDLAKEKRAIMKQWAKRQEQLERVIGATAGMCGDLQGIAGKSLLEIEGLELLEHAEPDADIEL